MVILEPSKQKRPYIRTKVSQDKPVDLVKLAIPFEYGWRREVRLRGINKTGKMIGEVFYYTPTDKRMRSWNDVSKYLKQVQNAHDNKITEGNEEVAGKEKEDKGHAKECNESADDEEGSLVIDEGNRLPQNCSSKSNVSKLVNYTIPDQQYLHTTPYKHKIYQSSDNVHLHW